MADRIKGITIEIGGDTTKLSKALQGVNKDLRTAQSGLQDVNKLLKLDPGNVDLLKQKQGYLNDAIKSTEEKLKQEREALERLKNTPGFDAASEDAKALERQIVADEQALKSLQDEAKSFGSVASQQFQVAGEKLKDLGGKIEDVGKGMSMKVTAPIVAVGAGAIAAFKDVDAGLDTVIAKTGASGDALADMEDRVKSLATTIPTDFQTAGDAIGEVNTRFGLVGDELEDLSGQFIKFAQLNGTDVSSSIDAVQAAMAAFNLDVSEAGDVLDILNKAGQDTGISVDKLASDLMTNATALQEMGFGINSATGFLANLNKNGVDSSAVLTGMKKALQNATKDGKSMGDALKQLEKDMSNATSDTEAMQAAMELFGNKAGPALAKAIQEGRLSFEELNNVVTDTADNVANTFDATLDPIDNWQLAMNQAKIAGAELGGSLQEVLAPMITKASELIGSLTEKFKALSPEQKETIVKIGMVAAAIGPALIIIGKLVAAVGSVISVLGTVGSAIGTVIGILGGPLTIAIAAAVAAGVLIYKNWDTIKTKAQELWQKVKETFENVKTAIGNAFDSVKEKAQSLLDKIKSTFETIKSTIKGAIDKIKGFFNFEWSLPKLKLPHFSLQGSFSLNPPSVPKLSVDWYKKAYNNPVMFNSPTVLPTAGGLKGFGDGNGAEIVMGLNKLRDLVGGGGTTNNVNVVINTQPGQDENAIAQAVINKITFSMKQQGAAFA